MLVVVSSLASHLDLALKFETTSHHCCLRTSDSRNPLISRAIHPQLALEAAKPTKTEPPRTTTHTMSVNDDMCAKAPAPNVLGIEEWHFV